MYGTTDTWTKPARTTMLTVNLPDGRKAHGELREIFTRRTRDGISVQFYICYDNGRTGMRVRIVDPVTMARWKPARAYLGTGPVANYKAIPATDRK